MEDVTGPLQFPNRKRFRSTVAKRAFVGPNPRDESITAGLPVTGRKLHELRISVQNG